MSKNQVFAGSTPAKSVAVPAGTKSGDPVKSGGLIGVAETNRNEGPGPDSSGNPVGRASVAVDGCYSLPVPDAVAAENTPIFITGAGPFTLTTTATGNTLFGHTRAVLDKGVATGGTKPADSGSAGVVNVELIRL